jgi:predicted dehydrogenase
MIKFRSGGYEDIPIPEITGSHSGADDALFARLFAEKRPDDLPTILDGMQAVLTGCAAVESIKTGRKVKVQPEWMEDK